MLLVALRGVGFDLWLAHPGNVLANLGVALGLVALVAWLMHRFRARFERDAAGRRLQEAEAELAELVGAPVDE
jgi:membrane protein implicated in regulation of membrane protease activity